MKPTNKSAKKMFYKSIDEIGDFSQKRSQYKKRLHSLRYKYNNELTLLEEQKKQEIKRKTKEMLRENELESQEAQSHKKKRDNELLSKLAEQKKEDEKIARENYLYMINYRKLNCARHLEDLRQESKTWWKVTDNIDEVYKIFVSIN